MKRRQTRPSHHTDISGVACPANRNVVSSVAQTGTRGISHDVGHMHRHIAYLD